MDIVMPEEEICNRNDNYEYLLLSPASSKDMDKTIKDIMKKVPVAYHVFGSERIEPFHFKPKHEMSVLVAEFLNSRRLAGSFEGKLPIETYKIVPYDINNFHGLHFQYPIIIEEFLEDYHPYLEIPEDLEAA